MTIDRAALVVGIDSYPDRPLQWCRHDATELSAALSMPEYGFTVSSLLDSEVTRRSLRQKLDSFFRTGANTYLFYFSGHGWATDEGVYLVTVDSDSIEPGVDLDYIKRLITSLVPPHASVVVILDCCHSGAATTKDISPTGIEIRPEDIGRAIAGLTSGRVVLASCGGAHLGYEDADLKHGVFTSCLLDGLLGEAADPAGLITVPGLYDYISRRMTDFKLQTPIFRGDIAGQLVLGQGLDPRRDPLRDSDRAIVIEREARKHLQNYQKLVAPAFADLNAWKTEGHKSACQALEPILGWFEGRIRAYPNLKNRPVFMEQHNAAMGRLASLCTLEAELVTIDGIVTDKLGSGNFGTVWNIKRPGAVPPLAYKVYHYQDLDVGEKLKRFRRGYDAMAQLDHPHIIKVHRFTKCPVGFYMTFIDGPNLRDFTGTLEDPCSLLKCLLTIAETLKHAHKRGVVHRDVKPENILMKYEKSVWLPFLTDFDLAWFSTATQVTKEARGTWQYSAPEQLATPTSASAHAKTTDSYSFGQLCYFALTGSDPVPLDMADNRGRLAEKLHLGWFVEAAEEFVDLYVSCTERNPKKRPLFGDICETLFKVYGLLSDIATSDVLSVDRFVKELVFSMAGLSSDRKGDDDSFTTLPGKTRVLISPDRQKHRTIGLVYDFHALVPPYLGGMGIHLTQVF